MKQVGLTFQGQCKFAAQTWSSTAERNLQKKFAEKPGQVPQSGIWERFCKAELQRVKGLV